LAVGLVVEWAAALVAALAAGWVVESELLVVRLVVAWAVESDL